MTKSLRKRLIALGCKIYRDLPIIGSVALTVPTRNLVDLGRFDFVDRISTDAAIHKTDAFADSHSMATQAWENLAASKTRLNLGQVVIGFIDSGINPVQDLPAVQSQSFILGDQTTTDDCGHGTDVAGIVCGNGSSSSGGSYTQTITGVASYQGAGAPSIMSLKVLNAQGQGRVSDVIVAMSWFQLAASGSPSVQSHVPPNARWVLNLSIGHPIGESYITDPLCQACETLEKMGVVIVCAAGNNGRISDNQGVYPDNEGYGTNYGSINSPANDPYVITVGAMKNIDGKRADDTIATYSSRGPSLVDYVMKPDIVAPGNQVISTNGSLSKGPQSVTTWLDQSFPNIVLPVTSYWDGKGPAPKQSAYVTLSGTSMATPVVTAAAAMMLAQDPTLSPDTVKARLMLSADKWAQPDGVGDPCTYGAGYIDIASAMKSTYVATQPSLSPILAKGANGAVYISNVSNLSEVWGNNLSGLQAIWGKVAFTENGTLASSNAIWGKGVWVNATMFGVQIFQADFSQHVILGEGK
jgi:serine protease AprX